MKSSKIVPLVTVLLILGITVILGFQLPNMELDNNVMNMIPKNMPEKLAMERLEDQFGGQVIMSVGLESREGSILSPYFLSLIRELSGELEKIRYVEEVTSLTTIDFLEGVAGGLEVNPLVSPEFSGTPGEIKEIKRKLLEWEVYMGNLISRDYKAAQIIVSLDEGTNDDMRSELYHAIEELLESKVPPEKANTYIAGLPTITVLLTNNMRGDLILLIPIVVVLVVIVLFLSFRRFGGVILPFMTVIISTIWTIGIMSLLHQPLSLVGTIIPVLLVAVGSAYGIHIISHYYDELDAEKVPPDDERNKEIIIHTLKKVGQPVILAGLTTIVGFGALAVSEIIPMRNFGIFTALGVLAASIVALVFIPCMLLLAHSPGKEKKNVSQTPLVTPLIKAFETIVTKHKTLFIFFLILIFGAAIYGTLHLTVDNVMVEYFKEKTEIRKSDSFIRNKFGGTQNFDIVFYGSEKGDLTNPEILVLMDKLKTHLLEEKKDVGAVISFSDLIKRMNRLMNFDTPVNAQEGKSAEDLFLDDAGFTDSGDTGDDFFFNDTETADSGDTGDDFFFSDTETADSEEEDFFFDSGEEDFSFEEDFALSGETGPSNASPQAQVTQLLLNAYAGGNNADLNAKELIRLVAKEINYQGAAYDEIPSDPAKYPVETKEELKNLIGQYLLLFSGSLDSYTDDDLEPSLARMMVTLKTQGTTRTASLTEELYQWIKPRLPEGYTVEIAGTAQVQSKLTTLLTGASTNSLFISLVIVFLILSFYYRSPMAGIIGIIPLGFTILINFGIMGIFGIKLNIATAMIGSIAIGIGIDYTIHFMSTYHLERKKSDDLNMVTRRCLESSGKAIIFNALSVAAGFAVLIFSNFTPVMYLGILVALTMISSSFGSLTIIPLLLNSIKPGFIRK